MVYIGANDGSLHALDLLTGVEQWAFVPKSMHYKLKQAAVNPLFDRCDTEYCHQYYVDGSPIVGDVYADFGGVNKDWRTILVIGEREGGEAYFALDVTSGKPFDDPTEPTKFLWEFSDSELGQTWADASIDRVAVDGGADTAWGVFFGSGYSNAAQATKETYLYGILAHDAGDLWMDADGNTTNRVKVFRRGILKYRQPHPNRFFSVGDVVRGVKDNEVHAVGTIVSIDVSNQTLGLTNVTGVFQDNDELEVDGDIYAHNVDGMLADAALNNALASPLVVDMEGDYISERIYAGDLYGNMHRVTDIGRGMTPVVSTFFTFDNTDPNINPIRAKADYAYAPGGDIWVYFGSGIYETQADKTDINQQYFFGLIDRPRLQQTYRPGELATLQARFTEVTIDGMTQKVRYVAGGNNAAQSWKMQLYKNFSGGPNSSGTERAITQPVVVGGIVFFTSFIPDEDICTGRGDTWVFALDYQSGLAATEPIFDLNNDRKFNDADKVSVNGDLIIPIGIKVGRGQGSQPVLHKDTLFITTTGDGADSGGNGNAEELFAQKVNLPAKKIKLESWLQSGSE